MGGEGCGRLCRFLNLRLEESIGLHVVTRHADQSDQMSLQKIAQNVAQPIFSQN
jgi:hypothetical protein